MQDLAPNKKALLAAQVI